jgi:hypothetical protein
VRGWVLEGVNDANDELGTNYHLKHIQFVASDSFPAEIYRTLAKRIVHRMHAFPGAYNGTAD